MKRRTQKIEVVETDNLAISLKRIYNARGSYGCKRSLYHAISMSGIGDNELLRRIREAMNLP